MVIDQPDQQNPGKFKAYAWLTLLSFGLMYLFFYNGRQNINLVMTQMAEEFDTTTAALGVLYVIMLTLTFLARKMKTRNVCT